MATFTHLATELLAHILKLSIEGEPAKERQRARFAFGIISRACYLATTDSSEFCVAGAAQAKAFVAQLDQEKKWAAQEERKARTGRTSRSGLTGVARISNVRRFTLIVEGYKDQKLFALLLRATPDLIGLELVVGVSRFIEMSDQLAGALGRLEGLQELSIRATSLEAVVVLKSLIPLQALEVLDLDLELYFQHKRDPTDYFSTLSLPNVRKLRIRLEGRTDDHPNVLFSRVAAHSTHGVQVLDLQSSTLCTLSSEVIEPVLPHLANIVDLTWDAPRAMTSLRRISMPMWTTYTPSIRNFPKSQRPIDHILFDTLGTLPSLHTVRLNVEEGNLSSSHVLTFIDSHKPLQSLSIHFSQDTWTREERDAVKEAADRAGVALS
ncbi:hypothetical protein RQP46_008042 [Phenoliferia psychrophenolica]